MRRQHAAAMTSRRKWKTGATLLLLVQRFLNRCRVAEATVSVGCPGGRARS